MARAPSGTRTWRADERRSDLEPQASFKKAAGRVWTRRGAVYSLPPVSPRVKGRKP